PKPLRSGVPPNIRAVGIMGLKTPSSLVMTSSRSAALRVQHRRFGTTTDSSSATSTRSARNSFSPKAYGSRAISVFHRKATPRFAASYFLTSTTRLKGSGGTGITEPSFIESYSNDPTFVGNRNLRPEQSRSIETGIEQHFMRSALVLDVTGFNTTFRDLIVFVIPAPPALPTWINLDASRAPGIESNATLRAAWLRVRGQYTFLDTRVTASSSPTSASTGIGQELPRRPRHSGSIGATIAVRRGFVNLDTTFTGERQDSDGV